MEAENIHPLAKGLLFRTLCVLNKLKSLTTISFHLNERRYYHFGHFTSSTGLKTQIKKEQRELNKLSLFFVIQVPE